MSAENTATAPETTSEKNEQKFKEFLVLLAQKGYFDGAAEGTPEYEQKVEKAREKFFNALGIVERKKEAERLKVEGNEKLAQKSYSEALRCYSHAIELDPSNEIFYNNRAVVYCYLGEYDKACEDCQAAIKINPKYAKAYHRYGLALMNLENGSRVAEAVEQIKLACELEPKNETFKRDLKIANDKLMSLNGPAFKPEAYDAIHTDPEFANNPKLHKLLEEIRTEGPAATLKYMNDPEMVSMMAAIAERMYSVQNQQ
eukprot:GEZU01022207.1.p1 GENE.GEZU01022207.1~~GEZU01022207.1.p1  ORF type:complete len:276 (-),score=100.51 GEZU01022207.1:821-1591(-)